MASYAAPLDEVRFLLEHVVPLERLSALPRFAHVEPDVVDALLSEAARFTEEVVAPTNRDGDLQGAAYDDGAVTTPASFPAAYSRYVAAGWSALGQPVELGGGGFPELLANVFKEFLTSANMAFSLAPMLTTAAVDLLVHHGSEEQLARYGPKLVSGEWSGTMNLTEPHAGSDVGAATTRAVAASDGTYRITGQKVFITFGEHDLTDQIVHLVLARLPDAPPGTKGLSLFIVPKWVVAEDGTIAERNDVRALGSEHKLGIHGSPTCVMNYGSGGDGAIGELIGAPNAGMAQMFTMMNAARLGVGVQGVAIAERAYQQAVAYARERRQGRPPGASADVQVPIVDHPDVRRMLLTQRASIEAARVLCYETAFAIDLAAHAGDEQSRRVNRHRADVLTPLAKSWSTDVGFECASLAVQVHGGAGYIEETGAAQHLRDARIAPIYEGSNGIQALDLVGRKLPLDEGRAIGHLLDDARGRVEGLDGPLATTASAVDSAVDAARAATAWLQSDERRPDDVLAAATPYLRVLATTIAGALLAGSAGAAQGRLDAGEHGRYSPAFLEAKVVTARFFATQLLPAVHGLLPAVTEGAADLMALDPEQF